MRSLMLGDCDHYVSPYMRGVAQAMRLLGHDHAEVSIRNSSRAIEQRVRLWQPDIIWTHMLLWAPQGSPPVGELQLIAQEAHRRGAAIVLHDGDAKAATRHPFDISAWCDLALVNHFYDRSAWQVPTVRWPYFAAVQDRIADPVSALRCGLFFAGTLGGGVYAARTKLVAQLQERGIEVTTPPRGTNTMEATPAIAASAEAVLGFGRPEVPGWVDTRVFQYTGAGGILLHDDVQEYLEPWVHYVPYESGNAASAAESLAKLRAMTELERQAIRRQAFEHVQAHHSAISRVRLVLDILGAS